MQDNGKPLSILIVDDEETLRFLVRMTLVQADYDVVEAESGEEGLRVIQEQKPDLVILDVMMPGIDGFEVCRRIRQDPVVNGIPIIMLSAHSDPHYRQQGRKAGANAYLTKPVNRDELLWRVAEELRPDNDSSNLGTS